MADPQAALGGAGFRARRATPGDAAALQGVMDAARDYFELTEGAPAPPGAAQALLLDAEADEARRVYLLGPPGGGAPLGFLELHLHQPEPGVAHVGVLVLRPEARGRGRGGEVVDALAAALRGEGFTALRASVGDENEGAHAFWERMGFEPAGRLDGGVTVYEKRLG